MALIDSSRGRGRLRPGVRIAAQKPICRDAVQKIESLLDVKAFEIQGRKAILTPTGQML